MVGQLPVLHLMFNEVGVASDVSTQNNRIELQKIVCLAQEGGLSLGYSFNWYVRGPYSPSLTSDYYQLCSELEETAAEAGALVLSEPAKLILSRVRALLDPPQGVTLSRTRWLELLASIAFLRKRYRYSDEQACQKILNDKATLAQYFDSASESLRSQSIID